MHDKIKICKNLNKIWSQSDWSSAENCGSCPLGKTEKASTQHVYWCDWVICGGIVNADWYKLALEQHPDDDDVFFRKALLIKLYDPKTCLIFFKHHAFVVLPQLLNYYLQSRPVNTDNICCIIKIRILQRRPQTAQQLNSCTSQQLLTEMLADYPAYWCCSYNNRGV